MNKYKYSFDLGSYFGAEESTVPFEAPPAVETSILPRPNKKQEAVQEAKPEYDPYGFIPDFAAAYEGAGGVPSVGSDLPLPAGQEQERYAQAVDSLLNQLQTELSPQPDLTAATPALNLEPPVIAEREEEASPVDATAIQSAVSAALSEDAAPVIAEIQEDTAPVATQGAGLMSPDTATTASTESSSSFTSSFVTAMGSSEGTKDHVDHLGIKTLAYGILPATAKKLGFDPDSEKYKDRKVLAEAVYGKMYDNAKSTYPDVFKGLTDAQKTGTLSLYINLGKLPSGVVTALSKDTPDFDAAKTSLASVVLGSPRNTDGSRKKDANGKTIYTSSKGLSKRRAKEYNTLMKGSDDFKPVKTVSVEGTKAAPVFVWKDADGTEVHRYTPSVTGKGKVYQGLDTKSSMKDVTL